MSRESIDVESATARSTLREPHRVTSKVAVRRERPADHPQQLPRTLGLDQFGNDPYRGVTYFARDVGYAQVAGNAIFQEFRLGRWLREQTADPLTLARHDLTDFTSCLTLVRAISHAIVSLPDGYVKADGWSAFDLGKLPLFATGGFNKLSVPCVLSLPTKKPGKPGYALQYKNSLMLAAAH